LDTSDVVDILTVDQTQKKLLTKPNWKCFRTCNLFAVGFVIGGIGYSYCRSNTKKLLTKPNWKCFRTCNLFAVGFVIGSIG
jgi:hypothetical protein